ncbi:MAG TPA: DegT/DnrJ/EryC1/StrS family aminotransferase [Candidatus Norongarragalinales archaeon]|nr:DegT/DnrJ/EryC1/StrS family aminotransferase [Candidatus Norongarragalinales archaeon]
MASIPWIKPIIDDEMKKACLNALENEKLVMGESVFKFEEEFAKYCGVSHAVSISSGTDALILTLEALGISGKKVLTTPASFVATANSILYAGGTPVFADCSMEDYALSPAEAAGKISGASAILPVDLYGMPARLDELSEMAAKHEIPLVEDACQAHGATFKGIKTGAWGTAGCFSFYTTKNLTVAGDGGMVTTNDEALAKKIAKMRDCGRKSQYEHDMLGRTARLNTINAAIGRVQLKKLDGWNESRRKGAQKYCELLKGIKGVKLPSLETPDAKPVHHLFPILVDKRNEMKEYLKQQGIGTGNNYPIPIHLQPLYVEKFEFKRGDFPNAEKLCDSVLCLPMFVGITDEEIATVCEEIKKFLEKA